MISASKVTLQYGKRTLFENVNILFSPGNCYGLIGANGSGKSTFLKILAGDIEPTHGEISVTKGERVSMLRQDQFKYDEFPVLETVMMGYERLYKIIKRKEEVYARANFSEQDGMLASELEHEFEEMGGWSAETEAIKLLIDLGIGENLHTAKMKQLESQQKVRVLLAQALFGNPDVLLLDEPTNHLDVETCLWLEDFLYDFKNTAIIVSHDRHFLDRVCTHIADIDFGKIQLYSGNYTFWYESSQLALRQRAEVKKTMEEKRKDLKEFIMRFSANASKSRQATSRKKLLEKLTLEDIKPSSRKYPNILFRQEREVGNEVLELEGLSKSLDGEVMFQNLNLRINPGDKVAFVGPLDRVKSVLFQIVTDELKADTGSFKWGVSTIRAYFPKENAKYFDSDLNLINWLRQFSKEQDENFIRGFLGRMLFSGEEALKPARVLSGGERVRCMLSRLMLSGANVLILDEPTNHLDLESITALNQALEKFPGTVLFSSHDHQFIQTIANRVIELSPLGLVDGRETTFDEYLQDPEFKSRRQALYPH